MPEAFTGDQVAALTAGPSFLLEPEERICPACGACAVRTYLTTADRARRPTLISYVWCAACRRFVGTRTARPPGLVFTDPLAGAFDGSVTDFFEHLDQLWDAGVLPQAF